MAPLAMPVLELKVEKGSPPPRQLAATQSWKVIVPVSFASGSVKVAVRFGVVEFRNAALLGELSVTVFGAASAVLFVTAWAE